MDAGSNGASGGGAKEVSPVNKTPLTTHPF
jgi:hypothetical protein